MKIIPLHKNEKQLIEKAAHKNRQAQEILYEMHAPKMLSICRMYIKDLHYAEDVMLKGFYKVFVNLKNFKHQGSFEGWVRKVMVREAIDFLRVQKKVEFSEENIEKITIPQVDEHSYLDKEAYLQHLIDTLPEGYKMVFVMYTIEGYKHKEIAEMLQINEGTSKSQLAKARKLLQFKLKNKNTQQHGLG